MGDRGGRDLHLSFLSRSWYAFTGQSEDALGFGWLGAVHPDDAARAEAVFLEANAARRPFRMEYRLPSRDGAYRWVIDSANPRLGAEGEFLGFIGSVMDITERKSAEERLRGAQETFRHLVERAPFGIYTIDADFRIAHVSDGAQAVFRTVRPLIGRDLAEALRILWPEPFASEAIAQFRHTLDTGEAYHAPGTVERRADIGATEAYDWRIERIVMPDGRFGVVCHFYDFSERYAQQAKIEMLLAEVNHRAKNMLSLVQAVASQTASSDAADFLDRFCERIRALAAGQELLVQSEWESADLAVLIRSQLFHFDDLVDTRISLAGPEVQLSPQAAQTLGMAIHEMATNAAKYGALSTDAGCVAIRWTVTPSTDGPVFSMSWKESSGPPVVAPTRTGFGRRVAKSIVEAAFSGRVTLDYPVTGVEWRLTCGLSALAATPRGYGRAGSRHGS